MVRSDNINDRRQEIEARLNALGVEQEERLAKRRADQFQLPYANLLTFPIEANDLALISKKEVREFSAALFYKQGADVRIGVVNPGLSGLQEFLKRVENDLGAKVQVHVISYHSLNVALIRYPESVKDEKLERDEILVSDALLKNIDQTLEKISAVGSGAVEMSSTDLLAAVVAGAIRRRVSDIHIEPGVTRAHLRYRIDGVLIDVLDFDREAWAQLLSRVKYLGKMKLNVRDVPQDGSFMVKSSGGRVDIRLSVLPGGIGEFIVMRLLSRLSYLTGRDPL